MASYSPSLSPPQAVAQPPGVPSRSKSKPLIPLTLSSEAAAIPSPSPSPSPSSSSRSSTPVPPSSDPPMVPSAPPPPAPTSYSKASASLPWYWVIEALADFTQVGSSTFKALLRGAPDFSSDAPGPVKERTALRCLEELVGMDREEVPPDWASTVGIDVSQSCEEVLCREMGKFCRIATFFNLEKDRVNLLTHDLQKFIIEKRNSLPKSSLDKIKESIAQENSPALMSFLGDYGFQIESKVDHPQCNIVDAKSRRVDNFKVSLQDVVILSPKPNSSVTPNNCIAPVQEENHGSMQKFLKQNVATVDRKLKRSNVSTGGNIQLSDGTKNKRLKIKLGTDSYKLDLDALALINKTYLSQEDCLERMDNVFTQTVEDSETAATGVDNVQTNGHGLQNVEVAETISGVDFQATQRGSISKEPVSGKSNASGDKQHLPNALNHGKNARVFNGIFAKINDPADLVKDAFVNKKGKMQHAPKKGLGENIHPVLSEKNHFNLNIRPGIVRDDNTCDVPSNIDAGEDVFAGGKHCFPIKMDDDSVTEVHVERGLCIKCKKGGEMLICGGSACLISVHKTCLTAPPKFDKSGIFLCPFCSYKRAANAYRKKKEKLHRACKLLSDFTGRDLVQGHQREWSPLRILADAVQVKDASKSCSELNVGSSWCTRNKANATLVEDDEQTYHHKVTQSYDSCKSPFRETQTVGNERIIDISHHPDMVNPDKDVDEIISVSHHSNADLSNPEIVPHNNGEQHQLQGKHSKNNDHLAFKESPCPPNYVHGVVQAGIGLNKNLHSEQWKHVEEKKDQCTADEESLGGKNGNNQEQDEMVADDHGDNMTSPGKRGIPKIRVKHHSNPILPPKRRSKLSWSAEEEDYLKDAIKELGENYKSPIPWISLLEQGRRVFHKTRQPCDLKDKWRNIKRREISRSATDEVP